MTDFEIWFYGVGFIAVVAVALCVIGTIADEWENIPRVARNFWQGTSEWLFDVQTAYWKFKHYRKRNKYRT